MVGGCGEGAAVCVKKAENLTDSSKLDPRIFSAFFSLLRKPAEHSSADCRTVGLCIASAVFLRKNERGSLFVGSQPSKCLPLEGKVVWQSHTG